MVTVLPVTRQLLLGPNVSRNDLTTSAGFVDDTWQLNRRVTLSLGIRLDRYQPALPAQEGPAGQTFPAIAPVLTFSNWGPRAGLSADLTGDGKTVLKLHYGTFWVYPAPIFTAAFNPNPSGWSRTYLWTNDANENGQWDSSEEGALTSVSGGITSTRLDPDMENTYVRQASAYIEREVARTSGSAPGLYSTPSANRTARSTSAGRSRRTRCPWPPPIRDPTADLVPLTTQEPSPHTT